MKRHMTACMVAIGMASATMASADAGTTLTIRSRVIGIEPIYRTVTATEEVEVCDRVSRYQDNSTIGTIAGGVAGGVIGNQVGGSKHGTEGAIIGGVLGAVVGNEIGQNTSGYKTRERCYVEQRPVERRVVRGYLVTTKINGKVVQVPTDRNPGEYVRMRLELVSAD